ncbi:MAG: thiol:disulfide interchange protein DsbA/DsbL [Magnetococcales bacterium]|nr:thiol:disulfide interchange protein DsbA/DsbL [Magnetococcales bacterium]
MNGSGSLRRCSLLVGLLLAWLVGGGLMSSAGAAEPLVLKAGVDYEPIVPPVPVTSAKPEVVEVFNFKCPHCEQFHPAMNAWTEKMKARFEIKSLPIAFTNQSDQPVRAFYAAQFFGREAEMKHALFNAHFADHVNIDSPQELAFLAEGMKFDAAAFQNHMSSFGVQSKVAQGRAQAQAYGVTGTPTLVINGRYRVSPGKHDQGKTERLFAIVETLAAQ